MYKDGETSMAIKGLLGSCFLTRSLTAEPNFIASEEHNIAAALDLVAKYSASSGGRCTVIGTTAAPIANAASIATTYS